MKTLAACALFMVIGSIIQPEVVKSMVTSLSGIREGGCNDVCSSVGTRTVDPKDCNKYYSCLEAGPDAQTWQFECPPWTPYFNGTTCLNDESTCCKYQFNEDGDAEAEKASSLCPNGVTYSFDGEFGRQDLTFCSDGNKKNWYDAVTACAATGGRLATIKYPIQVQLYLLAQNGDYWTGASDEKRENNWKWINGDDLDIDFPWSPNPNDPNKNCQKVNKDAYVDEDCNHEYRLICEVDDGGDNTLPTGAHTITHPGEPTTIPPSTCDEVADFICPRNGNFERCPYCDQSYFYCSTGGIHPKQRYCEGTKLFSPNSLVHQCVYPEYCLIQ